MLYKDIPDRREYRNSGREDGGGASRFQYQNDKAEALSPRQI